MHIRQIVHMCLKKKENTTTNCWCVSEEMPYISKEGNDTILFEVNFKNHGRWYKKELGHAKAQKNKIAWIKKEYP